MPSRPPDIKARNTSIDPLELLPPELFVFIFSFLYQVDIAISAASSKTWRRILLSSPHLFEHLDLTLSQSQSRVSFTNIERHQIINRQIGALIRASQLSNNRIKHLRLDLSQFIHDTPSSFISNWNSTRLATFFNLLYLSKETLRFLTLDLPEYDADAINAYAIRIEHAAEHIRGILIHLKDFSMLDEIRIAASSFLEIRYEWEGKSLEIYRTKTNLEAIMSSIEANPVILGAVQSYSRGSFTRFDWEGMIDRTTITNLWESRNSLKSLRLRSAILPEGNNTELNNLITNCANLEDLDLDLDEFSDGRLIFHVPRSFSSSSNLVKVQLLGDFDVISPQSFLGWLGSRVEVLSLIFVRWGQEVIPGMLLTGSLLDHFLKPLASTLKIITLIHINSFQTTSSLSEQENREPFFEPLSLGTLQELTLKGNIQLINYFLAITYPNLALMNLIVVAVTTESDDEVEMNHQDLRRAVTSCSGTLSDLRVYDQTSEERWTRNQRGKELSPSQLSSDLSLSDSPFSEEFQSLDSLTLVTKLPVVFEFSLNRYPRLSSLDLGSNSFKSLQESFMDKRTR